MHLGLMVIGQMSEKHLHGRLLLLHRGAHEACPVRPVPGRLSAQLPSCHLTSDRHCSNLGSCLFSLLTTFRSGMSLTIIESLRRYHLNVGFVCASCTLTQARCLLLIPD